MLLRVITALVVGVITGATFLQDRPRVIPDGWIAHPIYTGPMHEIVTTTSSTNGVEFLHVAVRLARDYLTAEGDPVLARTWDNEDDAAYDEL